MVNKENNPYKSLLGNYVPLCKNGVVFNLVGDMGVYWSLVAVCHRRIFLVVDCRSFSNTAYFQS